MAPRRLGRYVVAEPIASGGMATVYLGCLVGPESFSRTVAIKQLRDDIAQDPEFARLLIREARLAARVEHTNVVQTRDVISTSNDLAIVMEYVHGESLSGLLATTRAQNVDVPIAIAVSLVAGVLHGLHAAHEAVGQNGAHLGIVHRDVSPQNILVGVDGVARVFDFGIAKAASHSRTTTREAIWGKLGYMAPEQLHGEPVDRRTDVYAAGVVLWEVLTGRRLFQGADDEGTMRLVLDSFVESPSTLRPDVPFELDALVKRALQRDARKRFSTAREMALALEAATRFALPSEVGTWVDELARESLAARGAALRQLEESIIVTELGGDENALAPVENSRRRRTTLIALALGICATGALTLTAMGDRLGAHTSTDALPPSNEPPVDSTASSSSISEQFGSSQASPTVPGRNIARPPQPKRSSPRASNECDPPFVIDKLGHKRFTKGCFAR